MIPFTCASLRGPLHALAENGVPCPLLIISFPRVSFVSLALLFRTQAEWIRVTGQGIREVVSVSGDQVRVVSEAIAAAGGGRSRCARLEIRSALQFSGSGCVTDERRTTSCHSNANGTADARSTVSRARHARRRLLQSGPRSDLSGEAR